MGYGYWPKYVTVAERKQIAQKHLQKMQKKGMVLNPIIIDGRKITKTFWGKAWCDNLESYSDYDNRLPRGRTYARNGSILDLKISKGVVHARVMGSSLYEVVIKITPMAENLWKLLVQACSGKIDSLIELLQGKFSKSVMEIITRKDGGLFPKPHEISMECSCPDYASMCKHIAATLYGVGACLDSKPEWLFTLRNVDHGDLISSVNTDEMFTQNQVTTNILEESDLSALFGIEMEGNT